MEEAKKAFSQLEVAKIIGEPKDPRKPYSSLISAICETDTASPEEYVYYFDALLETDKVYISQASAVTQENVTPDTPAALSFFDIVSPEYYVKFTDLISAKEQVLARKLATINRAMNSYENYKVITLLEAGMQSANQFDLDSGTTTFNFAKLVDMLDRVNDYGDNFTLVAGTTVNKDIVLWDWTDNKYHSLKQAFADLNVDVVRVNQTVSIAGTPTDVLASTMAYLVAKDTEMGKPLIWVRKKLDSVKLLGGVISQNGDMPERLVFSSPNPITVTGVARYLAVGITGFEEVGAALVNPYAIASFNRSDTYANAGVRA
jgi:hypothetical protein